MGGAAESSGTHVAPIMGSASSIALPIDPVSGEESNVEQILYWITGAPSATSARKTGGSSRSIQAGPCERAIPAMPMPRMPGNRAS